MFSLLLACAGSPAPTDSPPSGDSALDSGPTDTALQIASALVFDDDPPSNLLLISIDTLRPDRLARYGGPVAAPALEARMQAGFVLSDLNACSNWTYASLMCVLSGRRNTEMGFVPAPVHAESEPLPAEIDLVADRLTAEGFYTSLISTTTYLGHGYGTARGYQSVVDMGDVSVEVAVPLAVEIARALPSDQRWFLHLHLMDPHSPYSPPEAYRGVYDTLELPWDLTRQTEFEEMKADWAGLDDDARALALQGLFALYDGEIQHLDEQLGALWNDLEGAGVLDEALVLVVSDHGEQFYDRGEWEHGKSLYGEELEALAFFWGPGLSAGSWSEPTSQGDLIPTALDALGLQTDGQIIGADRGPRFALKADSDKIVMSVQADGWKLHYRWSGEKYLFEMAVDPEEQSDRYDAEDPIVQSLWEHLLPEIEQIQALLPDYPNAPVAAGP